MKFLSKKGLPILGVFIVTIIVMGAEVIFYKKLTEQKRYFSSQDQSQSQKTETPSDQETEQPTAIVNFKIYRNEEFSFEFQYPENWSFHENTFYSPFSKFNLVGASPEENGLPDPFAPSLLANIVTPDFADRAVVSKKNLRAIITDFTVGGVEEKNMNMYLKICQKSQ